MKDEILRELALQQVSFECRYPRGETYKGFSVNDDMSPALRYGCFESDNYEAEVYNRGYKRCALNIEEAITPPDNFCGTLQTLKDTK